MSPLEPAVYSADTTSEILISDILEASHADKAGKCPLVWEFPNALHKILITCLIIGHHPACAFNFASLPSTHSRAKLPPGIS